MYEAHEALICIGQKTYLNDKNRLSFSNEHYFKSTEEMNKLFADLPEAIENNYNLPMRCSFRTLPSSPILPNISSDKDGNADQTLTNESNDGLLEKLSKTFKIKKEQVKVDQRFKIYNFVIPDNVNGPLFVTARMLFRPFTPEFIINHNEEFLDNLPVFEMFSIESEVGID